MAGRWSFRVRRLVVGNLKGGPGKTTTALHLAVVFYLLTGLRVLVVDADPLSQSAADWERLCRERYGHAVPGVVIAPWRDFHRGMLDEYALVIFDTGGESPQLFNHALAVADMVLIPVAPFMAEMRRLPATLEEVANAAKTHPIEGTIMLGKVPTNTTESRDARQFLVEENGLPLMAAEIPSVRLYRDNYGTPIVDPGVFVNVWFELNGLEMPADVGDTLRHDVRAAEIEQMLAAAGVSA